MKKNPVLLAALPFLVASFASADGMMTITERCQVSDSLNTEEALGRNGWYKNAYPEEIVARMRQMALNPQLPKEDALRAFDNFMLKTPIGTPLPYPKYPTFLVRGKDDQGRTVWSDPAQYKAPVDPGAAANKPQGYVWAADCRAGCFKPWVRVLFKGGYSPIKDALEAKLPEVVALGRSATFEAPTFKAIPVAEYTRSMIEEWNEILRIETESGGILEITPNHPLVDGEGRMREASTLTDGDELVRADGRREDIVAISKQRYFGKVYNLSPKSTDLRENVLVAEGFLTGSAWYQNDGQRFLNRFLLRANVPEDILSKPSARGG